MQFVLQTCARWILNKHLQKITKNPKEKILSPFRSFLAGTDTLLMTLWTIFPWTVRSTWCRVMVWKRHMTGCHSKNSVNRSLSQHGMPSQGCSRDAVHLRAQHADLTPRFAAPPAGRLEVLVAMDRERHPLMSFTLAKQAFPLWYREYGNQSQHDISFVHKISRTKHDRNERGWYCGCFADHKFKAGNVNEGNRRAPPS